MPSPGNCRRRLLAVLTGMGLFPDPDGPLSIVERTDESSVPPSIHKINSEGTTVLNARRAGSRGKFKRSLKTTGFGLKSQTATPKSAQLASRAPVRGTQSKLGATALWTLSFI
jgi:hypothetical protein